MMLRRRCVRCGRRFRLLEIRVPFGRDSKNRRTYVHAECHP